MTATYLEHGDIAVITLDNPPVNGLGHATRSAIAQGLQRAAADRAITAIVITGSGAGLSGGADIREFNTPQSGAAPTLHDLIEAVEQSAKPVLAAIHGICMGGGLELSLACHYRIAGAGAQIALPEVKLGLLPGAGGTQRLPRAAGLERALEMIVTGAPVPSERFAGTGLFDQIVSGELLPAALAYARQVAAQRPLPLVRERAVAGEGGAAVVELWRSKAASGAFEAPRKCVEAVAATLTHPFAEGLKHERALFQELVQSTESKALRHAFFAERSAGKIADVPASTPKRPVTSVAVVGAGTMGGGIAMNFANASIPVKLLEMKQTALEHGLATIRKNYENTVKKGKLSQEQCDARLALISGTLAYPEIAQADLVIEAVFEDIDVKRQVFEQLDAVMKPGAILASNTSTLDLNRIAAFTRRPQDVVGMHFFSPANVMKLLEIVRGQATAPDVLATVLDLAKKIKKTGVVAGVCDGFIGNRMLEQYMRQATFLLDEGCTPTQVDGAIERFGFAMGPFRMSDLAGNDISWAIRKRRYVEKPHIRYSRVADRLCEMGRFGQKTGAGWYDYRAGERAALPSDTVERMIVEYSAEQGIARRTIADEEIVGRLVYALVNEGACLLEEGIAARASDIDVVYLSGYGFPLQRGGPMFYADTVGLPRVLAAIEGYARGLYGDAWRPAPLLQRLAAREQHFTG